VTDYPRLVVVDRSGEWQVYRRSGYHSVDDLVSVLGRYRHTKLVSTTGTNRLTPTTTSQSPSAGPTTSAPLCKT
jgi:hypothetical protein